LARLTVVYGESFGFVHRTSLLKFRRYKITYGQGIAIPGIGDIIRLYQQLLRPLRNGIVTLFLSKTMAALRWVFQHAQKSLRNS
jgi:hypothetical protein